MDSPSRRSRNLGASFKLAAALLGAATFFCAWVPRPRRPLVPVFCSFLRLLGRPCPTCGLTRSWSALFHGDLAAALASHALGPLLWLGLVLYLGGWSRRGSPPALPRPVLIALALLWSAYALGRMARLLPGP